MIGYARIAKGRVVEKPFLIARPFSNFRFVDKRFDGLSSLRRILSQVRRHDAGTMLMEELRIAAADDLREENEDIKIRYSSFSTKRSCAYRLSFFRTPLRAVSDLADLPNSDFLGYAIVKCDGMPSGKTVTRVYESVLKPSRHENNFIRGVQQWECQVANRLFRVPGYLYAQQNGITNVCAHVALRTAAARFHPNGDMTYREMNNLLGINHREHKATAGLGPKELVTVLKAAGAQCILGQYIKAPPHGIIPPPFHKYVYGSVESGYPALVYFGTSDKHYHVVPVFGHTFNQDSWAAQAKSSYFTIGSQTEYLPSESWLSTYIGHDDNWGSNYCIPRDFLYSRLRCAQAKCVSQALRNAT